MHTPAHEIKKVYSTKSKGHLGLPLLQIFKIRFEEEKSRKPTGKFINGK